MDKNYNFYTAFLYLNPLLRHYGQNVTHVLCLLVAVMTACFICLQMYLHLVAEGSFVNLTIGNNEQVRYLTARG